MFAFSGYVAAIEWRRVQVERPSSSTSGGHSGGYPLGEGADGVASGTAGVVAVVVGVVDEDVDVDEEDDEDGWVLALACFVRARQAATDVQVRQLDDCVSCGIFSKKTC